MQNSRNLTDLRVREKGFRIFSQKNRSEKNDESLTFARKTSAQSRTMNRRLSANKHRIAGCLEVYVDVPVVRATSVREETDHQL